MKFSKRKSKVLHQVRNKPRHHHMPGFAQLESILAEKDLRLLLDSKLNMNQEKVTLWPRRPMVPRPALGKVSPASWGTWSFPTAQPWWGHTWSAGSSSGLLSTREMWTESSIGPWRWQETGSSPYEQMLKELRLEKRRLRGDLITTFQYLKKNINGRETNFLYGYIMIGQGRMVSN